MAKQLDPKLTLHGLSSDDLYSSVGLRKVDKRFLTFLDAHNPDLHQFLIDMRQDPSRYSVTAYSDWLCQTAPLLELFIAELFAIFCQTNARKTFVKKDNISFNSAYS